MTKQTSRPSIAAQDARGIAEGISRVYVRCKIAGRRDPASGAWVSHRQAAVLDALCDVHAKYLGDVARRLGVTPATLSLTIDRMARGGLVVRKRDAVDRRRVAILLTRRGRALQRNAAVVDAARLERAVARLPAAERAAVVRALAALAKAVEAEPSHED